MDKWKEVWNKKAREYDDTDGVLQGLFTTSGYESKAASTTLPEWLKFIDVIADRCQISSEVSVFEFGCGAGSFLYNIQSRAKCVGGADYSSDLIKVASNIIDSKDLLDVEAAAVPTSPKYDVVLAVGCFLYFPDQDYATRVLDIMTQKANRTVAIVDVNDEGQRELAEKTRREVVGKDYDKLYAGLNQLYLSREYFTDYAKSKDLVCAIEPHPLKCYPYRYNVFLRAS